MSKKPEERFLPAHNNESLSDSAYAATLTHQIRCTRCLEWRDSATTEQGRCINKAACGIRQTRRKRAAKREGQP